MRIKRIVERTEPILLILLALIFTVGLMFASAELPRVADRLLHEKIDFLDVATGQNQLTDYKTELFLSHYGIRIIGYVCLGLILLLIIIGFVLEKRTLASAGAILLFLPVFGHFAATMFFLGGLGFLRFLWLPFLDLSFDVMRLGDIILLPYDWIIRAAFRLGINLYRTLPFIITGLGIFIFLLGVLTWMHGRVRNQKVADFWIYRLSRHPQYLGWILWSYGVLFLPGPNMRQYVAVANTLPWLLSTMIIIAVAMLEERKMQQQYGKAYEAYRQRAPFLFPLPRFIGKIFSLPLWILFRKRYPERKREIAAVVIFYTILSMSATAFSLGWIRISTDHLASASEINRLADTIRTSQHRGEIRQAAASLAGIGGAATDSLINLLNHENVFVRWYCADALAGVQSEKTVQPLADLLHDLDRNVSRAAAGALGGSGSARAIPILIELLSHADQKLASEAARSLGRLKATQALPALMEGLTKDNPAVVRSCAWALGEIGDIRAVEPLIACIRKRHDCDFTVVGNALRELGSDRAVEAFVAGLKKDKWWIQTQCAAALGQMQSDHGFDPLVEALHHGEVRVRRAAILALANYPARRSEFVLREALADEDWEVRLYAEAALKKNADMGE